MKSKYFNMGIVVCTCTIADEIKNDLAFAAEIKNAVARYSNMDWGISDHNDSRKNYMALQNPDDLYLVAAYMTSKGKIFIITNRKSEIPGDNSTTIMFSDEY